MALAVVQIQHATHTSTPYTATFPSATTVGNLAVAIVNGYNSIPPTNGVTDNKGNTWTRDYHDSTGSGLWTAFYSSKLTTGGTSHTVTYTDGSALYANVDLAEVSGQAASSPFDQSATNAGTSTTYTTGATGTLAQAEEIVFVSVGLDTGSDATATAETGYTLVGAELFGSVAGVSTTSRKIVAATTAINHAWTTTFPSTDWRAAVATYKGVFVTPNLVVDSAAHSLGSDTPTLTLPGVFSIDSAAHAHAATAPVLALDIIAVFPNSALHTHTADSVPFASPPLYSDDFNRANGALGAAWVFGGTSFTVATNRAHCVNSDFAVYNSALPSTDHYVQAEVYNWDTTFTVINARTSPANRGVSCYQFFVAPGSGGTRTATLGKLIGGSYSDVQPGTSIAYPGAGTLTLRLEVQGTTLRGYVNGVLVVTATDTSITSGTYAGINSQNNGEWDNWATGIIAVAPVDLFPASANHGHTADGPTLTIPVDLVTANANHAHAADGTFSLTTGLVLTIDSAAHAHAGEAPTLVLGFQIQSANHGHIVDVVPLGSTLVINSANHGHTAGSVTLTQLKYPASVDTTHRKFLDQNGQVFLLKDFSSWGMGQLLSNVDITAALTAATSRHFNVVLAGLGLRGLGGWGDGRTQMARNVPFWATTTNGTTPSTPWASALGAGWQSFDWLLTECARLGLTLIFSFEIMTPGGGMQEDLNAVTVTQAYNSGVAIATRFASFPNIIWHVENEADFHATDSTGQRIDALFHGIRDTEGASPRLIIGEPYLGGNGYDEFIGQQLDHGNSGGYQWFKVSANSLYQYTPDSTVQFDTVWNDSRAPTYPVWDCEPPYSGAGRYDGNQSVAPGPIERQNMRERTFADFLRGGVGINWSHEVWWPFGAQGLFNVAGVTWQTVVNQPETIEAQYAFDLVDLYCNDLNWAPDNTPLVAGLGSGDTRAAVGRSPTAYVAYFPNTRAVTINTTLIGGTNPVRIRWYDPTTGIYTVVASGEARTASRVVTYPSGTHTDTNTDWVLVVDDRSTMAIDSALHAHVADQVPLTGPLAPTLVVDGAAHSLASETPTLGYILPVYAVVTDSALHGLTSETPLLALPNSTSLATANCLHGHTAVSPALIITALLKLWLGTATPLRLYVGATQATKAYIGATQVWP